MVLKADWEKIDEDTLIDEKTIKTMVSNSLPERTLSSYKIISGGCANLNIKLGFDDNSNPLILRVYLRDKNAALKEQKLSRLLAKTIPVPEIVCIGNTGKYRYALVKYIEGQTLRDVILNETAGDVSGALYETGQFLAKLQHYTFPYSGFFDNDLNVHDRLEQDGYMHFLNECLAHPAVLNQLGRTAIDAITNIANKYTYVFPNGSEHTLVHADYDPSNILVHKHNDVWKIAAILDWEFAFSGSYLCDVANMLRYAHQLPETYEHSFLEGLHDTGITLPDNWRIAAHLLNILSLLDCLARSDPDRRPRQNTDIKKLIGHFLRELETA